MFVMLQRVLILISGEKSRDAALQEEVSGSYAYLVSKIPTGRFHIIIICLPSGRGQDAAVRCYGAGRR